MIALLATTAAAYTPGMAASSSVPRAAVQMSTQYGDKFVRDYYKKKDPKTGSSLGLKGYTVGSRAPPRAVSSGTRASFGFGIDNLYGGGKGAKAAALKGGNSKTVTNENMKGLGNLASLLGVVFVVGAA